MGRMGRVGWDWMVIIGRRNSKRTFGKVLITIGQKPFRNKSYEITQKMNNYLEDLKMALHMCYRIS